MAQKTGMDRSAGDPDVLIGLDHLHFGMDHGVWIACGTRVWIGTLHFEPQPFGAALHAKDTVTRFGSEAFAHGKLDVLPCKHLNPTLLWTLN